MPEKTKKLVFSALFLTLALILPLLCGQIPTIGSLLLPMHLPILLCGFFCGPLWGALTGLIAPLLRSLLFGAPTMIPTALCMCFELAAYGAFAGLFYRLFRPHGYKGVLLSLALSMLSGRIIWGIVSAAVYHLLMHQTFTFSMFLAKAFLDAWVGILVQFLLIPPILTALEKTKLLSRKD